jgi:hypothetical protein
LHYCVSVQFHAGQPQHRVTDDRCRAEGWSAACHHRPDDQPPGSVVALRSVALLPGAPSSFMRHELDRYGVTNPGILGRPQVVPL